MQALSELKTLFLKLGLEVQFEGWVVRIGDDRWTMLDGQLYRNGEFFLEKNLSSYLKKIKNEKPVLRKRKAKKITANRSDENVDKSNQVD